MIIKPAKRKGNKRDWQVNEKLISRIMWEAVLASKDLREICGLIFSRNGTLNLVVTKNNYKGIGSSQISSKDEKRLVKCGLSLDLEFVGTFHSHIASYAIPGKADLKSSLSGELLMIFDTCDYNTKLWQIPKNRKIERLEDPKWKLQKQDAREVSFKLT